MSAEGERVDLTADERRALSRAVRHADSMKAAYELAVAQLRAIASDIDDRLTDHGEWAIVEHATLDKPYAIRVPR